MSPLNRMVTYVKTAWGKEPVIVSSVVIAIVAVALPWVSPYTRYSALMNERMPYHYPDMKTSFYSSRKLPKSGQIISNWIKAVFLWSCGGAVVKVQYCMLFLLTASCLQFGSSNLIRLKVDSAFHPSEAG